jgi:DNA-3-methyladenine glycosylase
VARDLLGCSLVRARDDGSEQAVVVVETEAYMGVTDEAAHTWNGRKTRRVLPMWGPGGHAYVYRIYGMYDCLNVVTREEGIPEAVLLRAAVPEEWWLGGEVPRHLLLDASGPGRLCRSLSVSTDLSGTSFAGPFLFLRARSKRRFGILSGPRIGVGYAGEAASWPLRFAVAGCPAVTRPRLLSPLRSLSR